MTPEEEIAALKAENATLREQLTALLERVQELEARLANAQAPMIGMMPIIGAFSSRTR